MHGWVVNVVFLFWVGQWSFVTGCSHIISSVTKRVLAIQHPVVHPLKTPEDLEEGCQAFLKAAEATDDYHIPIRPQAALIAALSNRKLFLFHHPAGCLSPSGLFHRHLCEPEGVRTQDDTGHSTFPQHVSSSQMEGTFSSLSSSATTDHILRMSLRRMLLQKMSTRKIWRHMAKAKTTLSSKLIWLRSTVLKVCLFSFCSLAPLRCPWLHPPALPHRLQKMIPSILFSLYVLAGFPLLFPLPPPGPWPWCVWRDGGESDRCVNGAPLSRQLIHEDKPAGAAVGFSSDPGHVQSLDGTYQHG